jgi:hypothetical protein
VTREEAAAQVARSLSSLACGAIAFMRAEEHIEGVEEEQRRVETELAAALLVLTAPAAAPPPRPIGVPPLGHGIANARLPCDVCGRTFATAQDRDWHWHAGCAPSADWPCPVCGKGGGAGHACGATL